MFDFIKRHRNKFIVAGVFGGGAYLATKFWDRYGTQVLPYLEQPIFQQQSQPPLHSQDGPQSQVRELYDQSRKHYIFDSNQRTCNSAFLQLLPKIAQKIVASFNVEAVVQKLKTVSDPQEKIRLWEEAKQLAIGRLIAAAYAFTLLMIAMKTQVTILAAEICRQQEQNHHLLLSPNHPQPPLSHSENGPNSAQIFLQALQFFTSGPGFNQLMAKIHHITSEICAEIPLQTKITDAKLENFLKMAIYRIHSEVLWKGQSQFVVPLEDPLDSQIGTVELSHFLAELKNYLDSDNADSVAIWCHGRFVRDVREFCCRVKPDLKHEDQGAPGGQGVPLASLIPVLTDCFHSVSVGTSGGVLEALLAADPVRHYAKYVFEGVGTVI